MQNKFINHELKLWINLTLLNQSENKTFLVKSTNEQVYLTLI